MCYKSLRYKETKNTHSCLYPIKAGELLYCVCDLAL